jgi:hypothetical protein
MSALQRIPPSKRSRSVGSLRPGGVGLCSPRHVTWLRRQREEPPYHVSGMGAHLCTMKRAKGKLPVYSSSEASPSANCAMSSFCKSSILEIERAKSTISGSAFTPGQQPPQQPPYQQPPQQPIAAFPGVGAALSPGLSTRLTAIHSTSIQAQEAPVGVHTNGE